jgi:hypothetical protein
MQVKKRVCSLEANDLTGLDINSFKLNLSLECRMSAIHLTPPLYYVPNVPIPQVKIYYRPKLTVFLPPLNSLHPHPISDPMWSQSSSLTRAFLPDRSSLMIFFVSDF